jgi:5'-3' exonuclease
MGVKNLWSLLEPTGRRVNIEALGGKRVAVDASIWLVQFIKAMRDERGDMLPNAHLIGFFRRICRLLYHRISPVMVFDGATPALKRRTTAARRRVRENQQGQVRRTAEKLLLNAMKASALKQAMENKNRAGSGAEPGAEPSAHAATDGPSADLENEVDLTNDDDDDDNDDDDDVVVLADEDPEWAEASEESEESEEEEEEDMFIPDADDVDPEVLGSLPPSVQMEVMLKMRERRVAENREHFQSLSGKMRDFSEMQMATYLKSTKLKRTMESVIKTSGGSVVKTEARGGADADAAALTTLGGGAGPAAEPGALAGKRIASNRDREFVFSKPVLERAGGFDAGLGPAGTAGASGSGSRDFANSLFGPRSLGGGSGRGRGGGRGRFGGGPLRAPQERFLLSSVNPALPTPTVSRTIAEMPVLPTDQRAGNEGKETLDLHIAFDAEDAAAGGVDPLFADAGGFSAPASIPTTRVAESPLRLAANDDGSGEEDEWEDVDDAADPERAPPLAAADAPIDLAGDDDDDDAETAPGETRAAPGASRAEPKRGKFWSLNHGFLKGRSLGQWDEAEEAGGAAAAAPPPPDAEGLEAALRAADATAGDRKGKAPMDPGPPSAVAASDGDVVDAARDVEDEDLQAVIAASLAPRGGPGPSHVPAGEAERVDVPPPPQPREDVPAAVEDVPGEDEDDSEAAYDEGDGDDSDDGDGEEKDAEGASPPRPASPPSPGSMRAAARRASGAATTPDPAPPPPADRIPSGLEDDDDDALVAAVTAAEAAAAEAARRRRLEDLLGETRDERGALRAEARRANAGADAPTEDMYRQIQDLLTLFGIPYVIAPQEAEAQCAWMNEHGLVDAVVTDDSDAFLFGAKHVYRNVFESKKYVEAYAADRVRLELGLDREKMAHLALLLGSDYTEGVAGVGIVNALEIVTAFPGIEGLREFKAWADRAEFSGAVPAALRAPALPAPPGTGSGMRTTRRRRQLLRTRPRTTTRSSRTSLVRRLATRFRDAFFKQHRSVKKGWELPPGFPSEVVVQAYARPSVDGSREKPTWGKPDLPMLRVFCRDAFDWDRARADELLAPVLALWEKADRQSRIDRFFTAAAPHAAYNERFAKYRSERLRNAVAGLTGQAILPELALEASAAELAEPKNQAEKAPKKPKAASRKPRAATRGSAAARKGASGRDGEAEVPKTRAKRARRAPAKDGPPSGV